MTGIGPRESRATLIGALWPTETQGGLLRAAALLAVLGTAMLTLSAKLQVPFWPVPMTMQTFVVLVIGMAYGWRLAGATVMLYLLEGAVGLPVFAGTPERGIGLAYMAGPTGGYLVGFVVAAAMLGWLAERGWDRTLGRTLVAMALGHSVIFACGVVWLANSVGWDRAVTVGLTPFWAATILKTFLGAAVLPLAWRFARRI